MDNLRLEELQVPVTKENLQIPLRDHLAKHLRVEPHAIKQLEIVKKSLDARKKSRIYHRYRLEFTIDSGKALVENTHGLGYAPVKKEFSPLSGIDLPSNKMAHRPVIIGSGPAGSFAALTLIEAGIKPIIVERGEPVEKRMRTVNKMRRLKNQSFDPESNYCFGEGGAGTFSDGKLTCGRNHPLVQYVFENLVKHGAPNSILYDAHPHIGTDFLMQVARNMRLHLLEQGAEFIFSDPFAGFANSKTKSSRFAVRLKSGRTLATDHLICAIGHSARDTYQSLLDSGLAIQPKPFAIGARFEHPQEAIDKIQFGSCQLLPAAEYKLATQVDDRGIWTFCMCPGGHLMPTSAQAGHLAINGMSYNSRNSGFANAAIVVNVRREDFFRGHPLDGMFFQANLEKKAFQAGGGSYFAPGQRLTDFLKGKESKGELVSTYKPGVRSARMDHLLPSFVVDSLRQAMDAYSKRMHGFVDERALVVGLESKTSSPICMPRTKAFESVSHPGFYPTGEGAGFAGGIVSAALDGVRVGQAIMKNLAAT